MNTKNSTWKLIQKWREYYKSSPNGWPVCQLIGSDYIANKNIKKREDRNA